MLCDEDADLQKSFLDNAIRHDQPMGFLYKDLDAILFLYTKTYRDSLLKYHDSCMTARVKFLRGQTTKEQFLAKMLALKKQYEVLNNEKSIVETLLHVLRDFQDNLTRVPGWSPEPEILKEIQNFLEDIFGCQTFFELRYQRADGLPSFLAQ